MVTYIKISNVIFGYLKSYIPLEHALKALWRVLSGLFDISAFMIE